MGLYATFVIREEKWNMGKGRNTKVANKGEIPLHVVCAMFPLTLKCSVDFLLDVNTFWYPSILSPRAVGFFWTPETLPTETLSRINWAACAVSPVPQALFPSVRMGHSTYTGIQVDGIWYKKDVRD